MCRKHILPQIFVKYNHYKFFIKHLFFLLITTQNYTEFAILFLGVCLYLYNRKSKVEISALLNFVFYCNTKLKVRMLRTFALQKQARRLLRSICCEPDSNYVPRTFGKARKRAIFVQPHVSQLPSALAENANPIPSRAWGGFDGRTGYKNKKRHRKGVFLFLVSHYI